MTRCTTPLLSSLMPVTLPAKARTAVVTKPDCGRLYDATQLNRSRRRLKPIWVSTRSSVTFRDSVRASSTAGFWWRHAAATWKP